ncbi:CRISPR-associated helicase/endonuclease Cas3 [Thermotoga neapolitana]|uniref:CRISPR-associated helicase/endonuclease Cas3 n=1 Tax=Thermotoga neapolitana TaxID=2337 RepID=UPI0005060776|nr:CRISPR-associated helicase/endonuclease Cas3 [Thermotoga neapolitana]KFZ22000.1 CRISPR-associated helicase Cas3 [Thermotoga neapolitana LA10]HBF11449.1 CRISPR-associated helicase/endonuclease Cas3 [Thermotoga neapolitana]
MPILAKSNGISLREHVEDVLKVLNNFSIEPDLKEFLRKAVFYHDLGKVSYEFQKKVGGNVPEDGIPEVPHSFLSIAFVPENTLEEMGEDLSKVFLSAILYHHWRETYLDYLFGSKQGNVREAFKRLLEVGNNLIRMIKEEMKDFLEYDVELNRSLCEYLSQNSILDSGLILPPHLISLLPSIVLKELNLKDDVYRCYILTLGTLMRADRFASCAEGVGKKDLLERADIEFKEDTFEVIESDLKRRYEKVWQSDVVKEIRGKNVVLVAPTGAGKTEFALMWSKGKTVFTLPLQSATNMMYERVKKYFGEENVGLLHSDAAIHLFLTSLYRKDFEDREGEILEIAEQSRFFSYPFVVATGDQVFPATLKYPGYEMIYSVMANSFLVIDEIQAYSPEAAAIIVKTVEDVNTLGGKFLIMTATLPGFIKDEIIKRTDLDEGVKDVYDSIPQGRLRRNVLKFKDSSDPTEEAVKLYEEGWKVLVVRNTVKKAIETYQKLVEKIGKERVLLVHSRMTLEDRKEVERILENYRPGMNGESIVLVSTQVVEASMDIDFDILLTDVAPADSLVQRMGRIFRKREWTENNPNTFIYIGKSKKEFDSLIKGVYSKDIVENTLKALSEVILGLGEEKIDVLFKNLPKQQPFSLNESQKRTWVEKTYEKLELEKGYMERFRKTLDVLDSGYSSEKKHEAHRIFRRISSMSIVPENLKEDLVEELKGASNYFEFKQITSRYLVDVPLYDMDGSLLEPLKVEAQDEKVLRWTSSLYVLKGSKYEKGIGIFLKEK